MSFIKSQKTGRRIAVKGDVWTLAYELWLWMGVWLVPFCFSSLYWVLSLNSLASKYLYKFSTWGLLDTSEATPGFSITTMYFFSVICRTLEVGYQWTPWSQYNLGDPLVRHDWFGKRYYCATSRRWPGGSTSESDKDPVTASQLTIRSTQLERKAWLYYWSGGGSSGGFGIDEQKRWTSVRVIDETKCEVSKTRSYYGAVYA